MFPLIPIAALGGLAAFGFSVGSMRSSKRSSKNLKSSMQVGIVDHRVLGESRLVLATEEIPLDNRFGNTVFVSEHSFSRTAKVSMQVELDGKWHSVYRYGTTGIQSELGNRLARTLSVNVGGQVERHVKLKLAAAPGRKVCYKILWIQNGKRGIFDLIANGKRVELPFLVSYGLSHEVTSIFDDKPSTIDSMDEVGL